MIKCFLLYKIISKKLLQLLLLINKLNSLIVQLLLCLYLQKYMNIPAQNQMQNTQKKDEDKMFTLNKINKKIDLLCLGQFNCHYTDFLLQYTGQSKDENEIQNVYVKKIRDQVVFYHEWKSKQELDVIQQFDGLLFFVDLINHLNNTSQTILKHLETLSCSNGTNIFRIPIVLIALNGSQLKSKQFQNEKKRLQRRVCGILDQTKILYYSRSNKQNFNIVNEKLELFVNGVFEDDPSTIKSSWKTSWKLYGSGDMFQAYWTQIQIVYFSIAERLSPQKNKLHENFTLQRDRSRLLFKKLWD